MCWTSCSVQTIHSSSWFPRSVQLLHGGFRELGSQRREEVGGESAQMAQFTPPGPGGGASPPVPYCTLGLVCIKCSVSMQCIKMQCTDSTVVHCSPLL